MTDAAKLLFSLFPGSTPPWLVVLFVLLAAFVAAWIVHAAVHLIACRFFGRRDNVYTILKRTKGLTRFALIILTVSALLPLAPLSGGALGGSVADTHNKGLGVAAGAVVGGLVGNSVAKDKAREDCYQTRMQPVRHSGYDRHNYDRYDRYDRNDGRYGARR